MVGADPLGEGLYIGLKSRENGHPLSVVSNVMYNIGKILKGKSNHAPGITGSRRQSSRIVSDEVV